MPVAADRLIALRRTIPASVEQLVLVVSLYWTLSANGSFFAAAVSERSALALSTWGYALALGVMLTALHFLLVAPFAWRRTVKPLLAILIVVTALAAHYMRQLGLYLDPSMLRNVLHTDVKEASELLSWSLGAHLILYAGIPLLLLWRVRIVERSWRRAAWIRAAALVGAAAAAVLTLLAVFQPFASLMRNHKEVRYLITPANYLWSAAAVQMHDARGAVKPRQPIGLDAAPGPSWQARQRPAVVVFVVGETARSVNWGLNGYARQTTPELAQLPVINFPDVSSCGTNTEVSVPCMFAPVGRRDYDEARIRNSESLLHVLARAGVAVHWRDNQSGCKGVCSGLPSDTVEALKLPGLCGEGHCLDEGLLAGLEQRIAQAKGTQFIVLHMLGNHGPSYFRRYPPAFAKFQPACSHDDLRLCSREEIVNAYDNALLYTDHILARLVGLLRASASTVDTAMVYVSDHGESLGENGLYLHGMPQAIAPAVQTHVPMVMWMSDGFAHTNGVDLACLRRRATQPAAHDHMFHTLLGLMDVRTALYEPAWDLAGACRAARVSPPAQ
jgi:lipid A ethanolaminephosphotransferase